MGIDEVQLRFSPESLLLLNAILGLVMYGVALEIRPDDFRRIARAPRAALVGVGSQFLALPGLTFLLLLILRPDPSIALGMILVAACPGGNVSNFIALLSRGNAALSVSLTAVATVAAVFMTPLNFAFWAGQYAPASALLKEVSLSVTDMAITAVFLLGAPLVLGMLTARFLPRFTAKVQKPLRLLSLLALAAFIVVALKNNFDYFLAYIHVIALLVLVHNAVAFACGYGLGTLFRLEERDRRSITIETGIQNSGLALVLIFNFYAGLGGMALIAALWGIWHLIAGSALAMFWSRRPPEAEASA
jgi:BASS family bile acid:Na+ symporter